MFFNNDTPGFFLNIVYFVSGCTASNIVFWNAMSGLHRFDEGLFFQECICLFCVWIALNFLAVSLGFPCRSFHRVGDVLIEFNMNCQIQYTSCNFQRL